MWAAEAPRTASVIGVKRVKIVDFDHPVTAASVDPPGAFARAAVAVADGKVSFERVCLASNYPMLSEKSS
jgi:hypothetical protein